MNLRNLARSALFACAVVPFASAAEPEKVVLVQATVFTVQGEEAVKIVEALTKEETQTLDHDKLVKLLRAKVAGEKFTILSSPQMMMVDGHSGSFVVGGEKKFVTGLTVVADNGAARFVPKEEAVRTGIEFHCTPTAAADRKSVKLDMNFAQTTVDVNVPMVPVTILITPVFEGGSQGTPVPFTQFIQQPKVDVAACEKSVNLAPDKGALVKVGSREVDVRTEYGPPVLSQVPYINRLFKNVAVCKETKTTFLCIKAKALTEADLPAPLPGKAMSQPIPMPQQLPPCALVRVAATTPAPDTGKHTAILTILLDQYQVACKAGDTAKARTIAAHCLELHPACFANR